MIDQDELQMAIELVEEDGPFDTLYELYMAVKDALGLNCTTGAIKSRIKMWGITTKTKAGKRGRKPGQKNKAAEVEVEEETEAPTRLTVIYTPVGECPCKLTDTDPSTVEEWAQQVMAHGMERGKFYGYDALIQYARQFYEALTPEWRSIKEYLRVSLPTK